MVVERSEGAVVPFVNATVAGHPLRLLIDTGAEQSILPAGFVRRYKLPVRSSSGTDQRMIDVNNVMQRMPVVPDVAVQFENDPSVENIDFLLNPVDGSETVGILSPQALVRSGGALVIDFPKGELRYEPERDALKRIGAESLRELDYHRCELDNHRVIPVAVNGVRSSLLIDTGAARTTLSRNNEAIPSMLSKKGKLTVVKGLASNGDDFFVDGIPIEFANTSFVLPMDVLRESATCGRGLLGSDVLDHCTLIWGSSSLWASCRSQ